ncbi:hypothetical protein FNF28_06106 [Cafeteria roenbergensis]|uniref:N-acetyltransferase domain-containing protein n=1 Tax=Cafeteria roenbergensis TaxID=33653 RepID=A0A5A8D057_CAFRO|nr:hypothetical protein FNF28_06106 [Cafeteria roenbergensis]
MASLRPFRCSDLLQMGLTNINPLTETYHPGFYYEYISVWPEYCNAFETMSGAMSAYILGKVEGKGKLWHGHVTAVTVAPEFRRLGMARDLMTSLEDTTDEHGGYFVDLFVRA